MQPVGIKTKNINAYYDLGCHNTNVLLSDDTDNFYYDDV